MAIDQTSDSPRLGPLQVVLLFLVGATVGGSCLLLSAAESFSLIDGAVPWQQESPLRAVVRLLCLDYRFPTVHAGDVKMFVLAVGSGLAVLSLGFGLAARPLAPHLSTSDANPVAAPLEHDGLPGEGPLLAGRPGHFAPLLASQVLVCLFLLWSFASARWSAAPLLSLGGSFLLTVQFLWSFALGNGMRAAAARTATRLILLVSGITAAVALWYYFGRNPNLRAKFPFGNPSFLAAALIPALLLSVTAVVGQLGSMARGRGQGEGWSRLRRRVWPLLAGLLVLTLGSWAFYLAQSRGAAVGLLVGLISVAFFVLRGRRKLIPVLITIVLMSLGAFHFQSQRNTPSAFGRDASLRFRLYAWDYAWRMFTERPLSGHGQGGFVLKGDSYVAKDVLHDPTVFSARVSHAHNEWLETLADLGAVGALLLGVALLLTLHAGMAALRNMPSCGERWALVGLLASLVALGVDGCFGVGLRVSGVPALFYTIVGLIWAMAGGGREGGSGNRGGGGGNRLTDRLRLGPFRRTAAGVVFILVGVLIIGVGQFDFQAARNGFRVRERIQNGDYEGAVQLSAAARWRLNPLRALTGLYRQAEAHALVAGELQVRATERERRARSSGMVNPTVMGLAAEDRVASDEHCQRGSRALRELVARSPGFLNHGRIEYMLNLIEAGNAAARHDPKEHEFLLNAKSALGRELLRQPFDSSLALEYVSVAGTTLPLGETIAVLARPLRHGRLTASYVEWLGRVSQEPGFAERFDPLVDLAQAEIISPSDASDEKDDEPSIRAWAPEVLRIAAIVRIARGEYREASGLLEASLLGYERLVAGEPFGVVGCLAMLAECYFFAEPADPHRCLAVAEQAMEQAPQSLQGRRLRQDVTQQTIDYYLAAADERNARRLLLEMAPADATGTMLDEEVGARYRRLCVSVLRRRLANVLRQPPASLTDRLRKWIGRAIELNPKDPTAHFVAADLAFHVGRPEETASHLATALSLGFAPESARQFLMVAREKRPGHPALERLWEKLQPSLPADSASQAGVR